MASLILLIIDLLEYDVCDFVCRGGATQGALYHLLDSFVKCHAKIKIYG